MTQLIIDHRVQASQMMKMDSRTAKKALGERHLPQAEGFPNDAFHICPCSFRSSLTVLQAVLSGCQPPERDQDAHVDLVVEAWEEGAWAVGSDSWGVGVRNQLPAPQRAGRGRPASATRIEDARPPSAGEEHRRKAGERAGQL